MKFQAYILWFCSNIEFGYFIHSSKIGVVFCFFKHEQTYFCSYSTDLAEFYQPQEIKIKSGSECYFFFSVLNFQLNPTKTALKEKLHKNDFDAAIGATDAVVLESKENFSGLSLQHNKFQFKLWNIIDSGFVRKLIFCEKAIYQKNE